MNLAVNPFYLLYLSFRRKEQTTQVDKAPHCIVFIINTVHPGQNWCFIVVCVCVCDTERNDNDPEHQVSPSAALAATSGTRPFPVTSHNHSDL